MTLLPAYKAAFRATRNTTPPLLKHSTLQDRSSFAPPAPSTDNIRNACSINIDAQATKAEYKDRDAPGMTLSFGDIFSQHVDMQRSRNGRNKGSSGSCTRDNPFDPASATSGGGVPTTQWSHDLSFPELDLCPNLTQIFGNLGGALTDESVILDASMLGCRKSNSSIQLPASPRPVQGTYKYGFRPATRSVHGTSNGTTTSSRKRTIAHQLPLSQTHISIPTYAMAYHESWAHRRLENYVAQPTHGRSPVPHTSQTMSKQNAVHTVPSTPSPYSELEVGQRSLDSSATSPRVSQPPTQHVLPSQIYDVPADMSWHSLLTDLPPPYPYSEIPYDNPVWLGESMNSSWNAPILCQNVYQNLIMTTGPYQGRVDFMAGKGHANGVPMVDSYQEAVPMPDKPLPTSCLPNSEPVSCHPYPHHSDAFTHVPSTTLPNHGQPTPSHNPSASTADISRRLSTVDHRSPRLKSESTPSQRAQNIRRQSNTASSSGVKKGKSKGKTGSRSSKNASKQFCVQFEANLTFADHDKIMTGVAPSGSGKSKVRKTEQAIRAAEIAGGDERVREAVRAALR